MTTDNLLSIQNLSVTFGHGQHAVTAVQDVSLDIPRGSIVAVVGESGSGKSVTSLSILRLLPSKGVQYSGVILFKHTGDAPAVNLLDTDIRQMQAVRGNAVSMIFQEPMTSLNPLLTCGYQVAEAIRQHKIVSKTEARQLVLRLFEQVQLPNPADIFARYPHQLSGGQKQRVMIAMAMSCSPVLLIADEPTTALDVTVQKSILKLIKELQSENQLSVIFITHDLGLVAEIADRVVVMYKGAVVEQGPTKEIFKTPAHPYTKALLLCRPAVHAPGTRLPTIADFMEEETGGQGYEKMNTTISSTASPAATAKDIGHPLVEVKDCKVWFPVKHTAWFNRPGAFIKAVDGIDFSIYPGETVGLVGESGCGKTTLGRAILRLVEPTAGDILFKQQSIMKMKAASLVALRRKMQIIFQDPYSSLNPRIKIGEAIAEVMRVHGIGENSAERKQKVMELLEKVQLQPDHFDRYPHQFSGGQKQRIGIARTLALRPAFIIWDESVSALDVSVQAQVLNLLNDLKRDFGFASLFISHDLAVVRHISDRVMVMYKGKIVESGTPKQLYGQPKEAYTRRLLEASPGKNLL